MTQKKEETTKGRPNQAHTFVNLSKIFQSQSKLNPIFAALMLVGIFIKFALADATLSTDGTNGPATCLIWGYGIIVFSLIGLIIVNANPGSDEFSDLKKLPWLILFTIALLVWIISFNIQYYTQINKKNVPDEYITWSNYSTFLLLCLLGFCLYQYVNVDNTSDPLLMVYSGIVLLFNVIAVSIQQIILSCFYVDG